MFLFRRRAKWKNEWFSNRKFGYVDLDEHVSNSVGRRLSYCWLYIVSIKSGITYLADATLSMLLIYYEIFGIAQNNIFSTYKDEKDSLIKFPIEKTIKITFSDLRFLIIIITFTLSMVLLFFEWKKGLEIVASDDIGYTYTSVLAYRIVSLRSYPHFCFLQEIQNSKKLIDILSFYVFFSFSNWMRLILTQVPRAAVNLIVLVNVIYKAYLRDPNRNPLDPTVIETCGYRFFCSINKIVRGSLSYIGAEAGKDIGSDIVQLLQIVLIGITSIIWALSTIRLFISCILYLPLLCVIRGDLHEYCCHKVDKRIDELIKKQTTKFIEDSKRGQGSRKDMSKIKLEPTVPKIYPEYPYISQRPDYNEEHPERNHQNSSLYTNRYYSNKPDAQNALYSRQIFSESGSKSYSKGDFKGDSKSYSKSYSKGDFKGDSKSYSKNDSESDSESQYSSRGSQISQEYPSSKSDSLPDLSLNRSDISRSRSDISRGRSDISRGRANISRNTSDLSRDRAKFSLSEYKKSNISQFGSQSDISVLRNSPSADSRSERDLNRDSSILSKYMYK